MGMLAFLPETSILSLSPIRLLSLSLSRWDGFGILASRAKGGGEGGEALVS